MESQKSMGRKRPTCPSDGITAVAGARHLCATLRVSQFLAWRKIKRVRFVNGRTYLFAGRLLANVCWKILNLSRIMTDFAVARAVAW